MPTLRSRLPTNYGEGSERGTSPSYLSSSPAASSSSGGGTDGAARCSAIAPIANTPSVWSVLLLQFLARW